MVFLKVWTSFREVISELSDAEKGRLFEAMLLYAETGEELREPVGNERFVWPAAKQNIDRTALKNEILRRNGMKGGRPKAGDGRAEPGKTKDNLETADETSKEKNNIKKKTMKKETLLTECKEKRFTPPTVEEVDAYCQSRGNRVNAWMFVDFYTAKGWKVGKEPMQDWKACIRTWEQREKAEKPLLAYNFEQRDYSDVPGQMMKELEEEMRAFRDENTG